MVGGDEETCGAIVIGWILISLWAVPALLAFVLILHGHRMGTATLTGEDPCAIMLLLMFTLIPCLNIFMVLAFLLDKHSGCSIYQIREHLKQKEKENGN